MSSLSDFSIQMMSYLTLRTIEEYGKNSLALEELEDYNQIVQENVYAWIDKVDEYTDDTREMDILKKDVLSELEEGPFLRHGEEAFIENAIGFLGHSYENCKFYEILWEAVNIIKRKEVNEIE